VAVEILVLEDVEVGVGDRARHRVGTERLPVQDSRGLIEERLGSVHVGRLIGSHVRLPERIELGAARQEAEQQRQADIARERRAENARKKAQEITQADIARKKDEDRLNKKRDERLRQAEIENAANRELEKYVRLINDALTELEKNGDSEGLASLGAIIASIAEIDSDVLSDEAKKALKAIWNRLDQIGCDSDYQTELFKHRDNLEQYLFKIKII